MTSRIIIPCNKDEVQRRLQHEFEALRDKRYPLMNTPFHKTMEDLSEGIKKRIKEVFQSQNGVSILDQGCGTGDGLIELVRSLKDTRPETAQTTATGVTASMMYVSALNNEQRKPYTTFRKQPHTTNNGRIKFVEADIHTYPRSDENEKHNIIYSDNAYMHLSHPWLAFMNACHALTQNGVLAINHFGQNSLSITENIYDKTGKRIPTKTYLRILQEQNPQWIFFNNIDHGKDSIGAIQGKNATPIRSNLHYAKQHSNGMTFHCLVHLDADEAAHQGFTSIDKD